MPEHQRRDPLILSPAERVLWREAAGLNFRARATEYGEAKGYANDELRKTHGRESFKAASDQAKGRGGSFVVASRLIDVLAGLLDAFMGVPLSPDRENAESGDDGLHPQE